MNTNELAVLLDNTEFPLCREAATMLRQQQAEIEALHKEREGLCVFCVNRAILKKASEK